MERDLPQSQTGGLKLMTVFIVVLALHVVVIGGISAYHIMRGDDKEAQLAFNARNNPQPDAGGMDPQNVAMPSSGTGDNTVQPGSSTQLAYSNPVPLPADTTAGGGNTLPPIKENQYDPTGVAPSAPSINPQETTGAAPRPIPLPENQQTVPNGMGMYTVKSGDTLQKIAKSHNMTVQDIMDINNMPQDHIRVGQKLKLTGGRLAATDPSKKNDATGKNKVAKKDGDADATASDKDKNKKNSTATAKNDTKTDKDKADKSEGRKHKVESGDTVFYLAKRYKTSVAAIRAANGLDENVTKPKTGTMLKIPGGSTKDVAKAN